MRRGVEGLAPAQTPFGPVRRPPNHACHLAAQFKALRARTEERELTAGEGGGQDTTAVALTKAMSSAQNAKKPDLSSWLPSGVQKCGLVIPEAPRPLDILEAAAPVDLHLTRPGQPLPFPFAAAL